MADELRRHLNGEPIKARPARTLERGWKWARRHPTQSTLIAVAVLLLIAIPLTLQWLWYERKATVQAEEQEQLHRYFRNINLADREWQLGFWDQAETLLEACAQPLRNWEWHHLKRRCHSELRLLRGSEKRIVDVSWSANGRYLATADRDSTVWTCDLKDGTETRIVRQDWKGLNKVAFGPDPLLFLGCRDGNVRVWDMIAGQEVRQFQGGSIKFNSLAYCAKGQILAAGIKQVSSRFGTPTQGRSRLFTVRFRTILLLQAMLL